MFAVLTSISAAHAQGVPIGALPTATLPLSGSEYTILSQNGTTVKATVNAVSAPALTIPNNNLMGNVSGATAQAVGLSATQVQTLLGLGTAAYQNIGTSGSTVPMLSNANTWSSLQTFSGGISVATATFTTLNVTGTTSLGTGSVDYAVITGGGAGARLATNGGTLTIAPFAGTTAVTGSLATSTTLTAGTGLTVTTGGALISGGETISDNGLSVTGGLQVLTLGAQITGNTSVSTGTFTANGGAVTLSPAANVVISPSGAGVVTINPATAGTINNMVIGGSTALAGTFTTATASTAFRGTDFGSGSASTVGITTTGGTQLQVLNTATVTRNITITGSNGGNPTINTTAGSLAITPATVFASTTSATTVTASAGLSLSGATSPISLNGAAGTSGNVLTSAGAGATPTWTSISAVYPAWGGIKTTGFNAVAGTAYCVDTLTSGAVTMTLPASPTDGDQIRFIDCKSNFAAANLTVSRNGKSIMGLAADMTVNTVNAAATLTYVGTNSDWRMY